MADPGDHRTAADGGRGRLRASRADREQAIEALKAAFVQDRLDKDELDTRVGARRPGTPIPPPLPNTRSKGQPRGRSWRGCRMAPGGAAALRLPASC